MSERLILWRITLPQVVRRMLPEALNLFVSMFKATTIVSLIAVPDLMSEAGSVSWMFKKKGYIVIEKSKADEDTLMVSDVSALRSASLYVCLLRVSRPVASRNTAFLPSTLSRR